MVRIGLIGVGVVATALVGYLGKRTFLHLTSGAADDFPEMPELPRTGPRVKRVRRSQVGPSLDTGDEAFGPMP
jgi:hypothetical protein